MITETIKQNVLNQIQKMQQQDLIPIAVMLGHTNKLMLRRIKFYQSNLKVIF